MQATAMMTNSDKSIICCDANLIVRAVVDRSATNIRALLAGWTEDRKTVVAPALLKFEITNAIHRIAMVSGDTDIGAMTLLENALAYPVELRSVDLGHARALALSRAFRLPAAYDAHYLALAESLGCEFFTMDAKLHRAVGSALPWVTFVG